MISFIKSKLIIGKHLEIIKEINHQKKLRKDLEEIMPSEDDSVAIHMYNANSRQINQHIESLVIVLDKITKAGPNVLQPHKIKEMFEKPYPVESGSFVYYVNSELHTYDMLDYLTLETYKHSDLEDIHKYIDFMKSSKFNKKFSMLYTNKIKSKLTAILEKCDYGGEEYMDHKLYIESYNEDAMLKSIDGLTKMVEIYKVVDSLSHKKGIVNKLVMKLDENIDSWLIKFIESCSNFKATLLIENSQRKDNE
jgi:hypothetical protein